MMKFHTVIWIIMLLLIVSLIKVSHLAEVCEEDADSRITNVYINGSIDAAVKTRTADLESENPNTLRGDDIGGDFHISIKKSIFSQILLNNSSVSSDTDENEEIQLVRDPRFWTALFSLFVIMIGGIYVFINFRFLQDDQDSCGEAKRKTIPKEGGVQKATVSKKKETDTEDADDELDIPDRRPFHGRLTTSFSQDRQPSAQHKKFKKHQNFPITGQTKEVKALPPHQPIPNDIIPPPEDLDP